MIQGWKFGLVGLAGLYASDGQMPALAGIENAPDIRLSTVAGSRFTRSKSSMRDSSLLARIKIKPVQWHRG
jgi:hypothetical protein